MPAVRAPSSPSLAGAHGWRLPAALLAVYVVWGSTYLAIRVALPGFPPLLLVGLRYAIAGAILLVVLRLRGAPAPRPGDWLRALPVGVLLFVGGNGFVALGERDIGSGLAAVIVATLPLWMTILAALAGERPRRRELLGLAVGLVGVVVLAAEGELRGAPLSTALLFLAALSWAIGSVLARRLALPPGAMAPALEMLLGGLAALVVGLAHGERLVALPAARPLLAFVYLIVFGSWIGFMAYAWLLAHTSPALATSYAFVNPIIAVALGALLGDERFGWATAAAAPLVVIAVALVVTGRAPAASRAGAPAAVTRRRPRRRRGTRR